MRAPEDCLTKAIEMERLAEACSPGRYRDSFTLLAAEWRFLADTALREDNNASQQGMGRRAQSYLSRERSGG